MRKILATALVVRNSDAPSRHGRAATAGNDAHRTNPSGLSNPALIPISDRSAPGKAVADVVDDYCKIEHESRPPDRRHGSTKDESILTTSQPDAFGTLGRDTAGEYERVETPCKPAPSGLVRVWPTQGGHWVEVACSGVGKISAGPNTPRPAAPLSATNSSFTRVVNPEVVGSVGECWIPLGRDPVLDRDQSGI